MNYEKDNRVVLTLDAGGTNFVFSAIQGNEEIVDPVTLPSNADDLQKSLQTIIDGFDAVNKRLKEPAVAVSFAFPGPADYPNGVIGDLVNLPCFRGGVALGPMLERRFQLPVFINNDGDLFAYGEAIAGFTPWVNDLLRRAKSPKQYHNLLGLTFGTGFGAGIVRKQELFLGDNSAAAEIWSMRHRFQRESFAEEGVSIRGVQRAYAARTGSDDWAQWSPKEIYEIAKGSRSGDQQAARDAFAEFARIAGDAIANADILIDGLVVIGGGLIGAHDLFLPTLVEEMNAPMVDYHGKSSHRMEAKAYNLQDKAELELFLQGAATQVVIPGYKETVPYDPLKRIGVGLARLGTSRAISIGAYAFALHALDQTGE